MSKKPLPKGRSPLTHARQNLLAAVHRNGRLPKRHKALGNRVQRKPGRRPRDPNDKLPGTLPGPLTPQGSVAGQAHKEAVMVLTRSDRRARAADLFIHKRMTYAQIGRELGVDPSTIAADLKAVLEELKGQAIADMASWRQLEVARTHQADRVLVPLLHGVTDAKVSPAAREELKIKAARQLVQNADLRAKLLGTYAPVKVAQTDPTGERSYGHLSDAELVAEIAARERELGLPAGSVDVEATQRVLDALRAGVPTDEHLREADAEAKARIGDGDKKEGSDE